MSQQEMSYQGINRDGPRSFSPGYEAMPHYTDSFTASYGLKVVPQPVGKTPSALQRLILAVVSLILWMVMCLLLIVLGYATRSDRSFFDLIIFMALPMFTALIVVVNVVFNRKG